jgi:hypothetical protein
MLLHIRQRGRNDCVIAVAAMLCNIPYPAVWELAKPYLTRPKILVWSTRRYLESITQFKWSVRRYWLPFRLCRFPLTEGPTLVVIRSTRVFHAHGVVVARDWIHDPALPRGYKVDEYPYKNKTIIRVIQPHDWPQLHEFRQRNWAHFYQLIEFGMRPRDFRGW